MNSSRSTASRQRRFAAFLWLLPALSLINAGCRGIYRDSEKIFPPDPCARLKLRLDQARQAQRQADLAAARLRDRYTKGVTPEQLETDLDRFELAARESARRLAAISDTISGCDQSESFDSEVQRLQAHSAQTLEAVHLLRSEGLAYTLRLLDRLLESTTNP